MSVDKVSLDFEPAIWARLIQAPKAAISPEAARYLVDIDFGDADQARMQELMEKSNEGTLTPEETASQARVALNKPGFEFTRNALNS
jgi:hypothetical protein